MTDLKPCPFCGSTNVDPEGWMAKDMNDIITRGPTCEDCDAAAASVTAWNTRTAAPVGEGVEPVDPWLSMAVSTLRRIGHPEAQAFLKGYDDRGEGA
jgi:hypothetical protein